MAFFLRLPEGVTAGLVALFQTVQFFSARGLLTPLFFAAWEADGLPEGADREAAWFERPLRRVSLAVDFRNVLRFE